MDAYSRLIRWLTLARTARDFHSHPFAATAQIMADRIQQHVAYEAMESVDQMKRAILEKLRHQDSQLALAALFFLVDYEQLAPRNKDVPFSNWQWPSLEIEWDMRGTFKKLVGKKVLYEGGEAKLKYRRSSVLKQN